MAIDKVFFSTLKYSWNDPRVELLNSANLDDAVQSVVLKNYHTSIEDITTKNIQQVCQEANQISLVDIDYNFFIHNKVTDRFSTGRLLNELFKVRSKVENFDFVDQFNLIAFNNLANTRTADGRVLWTAGCSFTVGDGVHPMQRYGHILSTKLGIPEVMLARSGSSIIWSADQILRSNIQPKDIVVWGLTSIERFEYVTDQELHAQTLANGINLRLPIAEPLEYFDSNLHLMRSVRSILQVINFCRLVGAELYIANLLEITYINVLLAHYNKFIDLTQNCKINDVIRFVDYGTDRLHPGPEQHKIYAERIYEFIRHAV